MKALCLGGSSLLLAVAGTLGACAASDETGAVGGSGGQSAAGGFGGSGAVAVEDSGTSPDSDATCSKFEAEATVEIKPVDIVFIVDNSGSMSEEAAGVEQNINVNFANLIQSAGLDYRVILITEQGPTSESALCIGAPLGAGNCPVDSNVPPVQNPPIFHHYDNGPIGSWDAWCKAKAWYAQPDRYNQAPGGWREWLRQEAFKTFVVITDDFVYCNDAPPWYCAGTPCNYSDGDKFGQYKPPGAETDAAEAFDHDLLAMDPAQFGTAEQRNYVWHSIVGLATSPTHPSGAHLPSEPLVSETCPTADSAGLGNQALSRLTGGLRFPVCEGHDFDVVFQEIAKGVVSGAKIACEFDVPAPPEGKHIDLPSISVDYSPAGDETQTQTFDQVADLASCKPGSFYIDADEIKLCPQTCAAVQDDHEAKISVVVSCLLDGPK